MDVLIQGTLSLLYMGSYSDWYMYIVHVYNSNRTKRSPIQAVIIQVINKIGWLHCEGIRCTFSSKKKTTVKGAKCETIACTCDTFFPLTQAWCVNCPITLSNYKHDVYTVLLVLKLSWRTQEFCYSFDQWNQGFWIATKHNCTSGQFSGYAFCSWPSK